MKSLAAPQVQRELVGLQVEPLALDAAAFGALIRSEAPFWTDFVRRSGIRLEP